VLDENSRRFLQHLCDERVTATEKSEEAIPATPLAVPPISTNADGDEIEDEITKHIITPTAVSVSDFTTSELRFPDGDNDGGSIINLTTTDTLLVECIGLNNDRVNKFSNIDKRYCQQFWSNFRGWRSHDCIFKVPIREDGLATLWRCPPCLSAKKNIRFDRHPKLFADNLGQVGLQADIDKSSEL